MTTASDLPPYLGGSSRRYDLREAIGAPGTILVPGVTDVLTARIAQQTGFTVAYVTGAGIANAEFGVADVGLTGLTDVATVVARIASGVSLPLIVDADTGYGNAIAVMRAVATLEAAGASAIQLEDQVFPKRCGHFDRKAVIPAEEMVQKIRAAVRARRCANTLLVARTDARAIHGLENALDRAEAYADAGADILFVEAPESEKELAQIPQRLSGIPLLVNLVEGGRTPMTPRSELEAMGYKLLLYANLGLRAAAWAVRNAFQRLHEDGDSRGLTSTILSWDERQELVYLPRVSELEDEFAPSPTVAGPDSTDQASASLLRPSIPKRG